MCDRRRCLDILSEYGHANEQVRPPTLPWIRVIRIMSITIELLQLVRGNDNSVSRWIVLNLLKLAIKIRSITEQTKVHIPDEPQSPLRIDQACSSLYPPQTISPKSAPK